MKRSALLPAGGLALLPDYAEAHYNLGNALKDQGNLDEAVACFGRALRLKPDYAEAHSNLGVALKDQGNLDEAVACFGRALHLKPDYAQAHYNLGIALKRSGETGRSRCLLPQGAAPEAGVCPGTLQSGHRAQGSGETGRSCRLLQHGTGAETGLCRGTQQPGHCGKRPGKSGPSGWPLPTGARSEAGPRRSAQQPWQCAQGSGEAGRSGCLLPAGAHAKAGLCRGCYSNLGVACCLSDQGNLDEAVACYRRALALKPDFADAHWNQSLWTLLTGDFENGWPEYEWRWQTKTATVPAAQFLAATLGRAGAGREKHPSLCRAGARGYHPVCPLRTPWSKSAAATSWWNANHLYWRFWPTAPASIGCSPRVIPCPLSRYRRRYSACLASWARPWKASPTKSPTYALTR